MMNDQELNSLSRIIAGALRHFPEKLGLMMDGKGWVEMSSLIDDIGTAKENYLDDTAGLGDIRIVKESDTITRFELDPSSDPKDDDESQEMIAAGSYFLGWHG